MGPYGSENFKTLFMLVMGNIGHYVLAICPNIKKKQYDTEFFVNTGPHGSINFKRLVLPFSSEINLTL